VCAAIQIPGYTALVSTLASRGDVPADLISRSLESHFTTVGYACNALLRSIFVIPAAVIRLSVCMVDARGQGAGHKLKQRELMGPFLP
jgi:hypothetical protein